MIKKDKNGYLKPQKNSKKDSTKQLNDYETLSKVLKYPYLSKYASYMVNKAFDYCFYCPKTAFLNFFQKIQYKFLSFRGLKGNNMNKIDHKNISVER